MVWKTWGGGLKANFVLEGGFNLDTGDGKSVTQAQTDSGFQFKRRSPLAWQVSVKCAWAAN